MPAFSINRTTDDAVVLMAWHDVHVMWIQAELTVANQLETEKHAHELVKRYPVGLGLMVVINSGVPSPSAEMRRELDRIYRDLTPHTRCLSYVVLAKGVEAAMVRGVLVTMNLLTKRPYPASVSTELKKGADWLFYTLGNNPERGTVSQFLDALASAVRGEAPQTLRTPGRG